MGTGKKIIILALTVYVAYIIKSLSENPEVPKLDRDAWWGVGDPKKVDESIFPFEVNIPQQVIFKFVLVSTVKFFLSFSTCLFF